MRRLLTFSYVSLCLAVFSGVVKAADNDFTSLTNGTNLDGWIQRGGNATFSFEDGCIVGKRGDGPNSFLCTEKEYGNFILKFDCKFDKPIHSGVQLRSHVRTDGDREVVYGYQCKIADGGSFLTSSGCLYGIYGGDPIRDRWLDHYSAPGADTETASKAFQWQDWNSFEIQCVGPTIKTWVNGVLCANYFDTASLKGFIGLEVHASETDGQIRWKNLVLRELPESVWVPLFKDKEFSDLWVSPAGKWEMDDEGIVHAWSTADQSRDGMLKTPFVYRDFAARVKFKQIGGNSGMYFRGVEIDKPHWLAGYQNEIDANATGSLWEVREPNIVDRGGWILRNFDTAAKVFKTGEWNELCVVAVGDRLVTILNGQEIANFLDPQCLKMGKLALQLHGHSNTEYYFKDWEVLTVTKEQRDLIER
ncbi:MAG: DUF1080 domain-containing protein [Planctomycetaceae bacterium]|jgi:hypothetical protein|nr:DUF1080 domain-containing protein [Planctomycetaceae bacterium]